MSNEAVPIANAEYVNTPQNDKQQIEQIIREYESEPAKGLAHGIQKDAIQNGVGARIQRKSEPKSYPDWQFTFELLKINGKYALSFWDEGTTGLTGEILSANELEQWSSDELLTADQNLSRFLTRFDSGGSIGPGAFGRGKLIFQGASKDYSILCDSLRFNDGRYVAFNRKIIGNQLKQLKKPYQDKAAVEFIKETSGGTLDPLTKPGTRVTILDLKEEIAEAIKKSFDDSGGYYLESFARMIEETWWEIIDKFGAKIYVKWEDKIKQVELTEPLKSIAEVRDKENGWRIYKKTLQTVVVDGMTYKIKELKFAVSPTPVDEELRGIWGQRKRMKIGDVSRWIFAHHTIQKRLCGYVIFDSDLEDMVEKCESTTHYSFNLRGKGMSQIREVIRHNLDLFQQSLGLRIENEQSRDRRDLLDTLKEINENARDLGLITDFSIGTQSQDVEISIDSFILPNENSKRVEINQPIGPITFKVKNNTQNPQFTKLYLTAEQRGDCKKEKALHQENIDLEAGEVKTVTVDEFQFDADDFRYSEGILIIAKVTNRKSGSQLCQVSRMVWFGREEPESTKDPFVVTAYQPIFPRTQSRRVEQAEAIRNIRFKVSNNTAFDVKINADLVVRKTRTASADYKVLEELITEKEVVLHAMSEKEYAVEAVNITNETYGWIFDVPANADERKCEIFFSVRSAESVRELNLIRGKKLGKKKIDFYLGIDPPGHSIFKDTWESVAPENGKRSWYEGDRASGYIFVLNSGHPSYVFAKDHGADIKKWYIREQMLIQGYAIAVAEGTFQGVAKEFSDALSAHDIPPAEAFLKMDEIVGTALLGLGG